MKVGIHEVNEKWLLHFAVTNCFLDQKKKCECECEFISGWQSRQEQVVGGGERMSYGSVSTSLLSWFSFQR